MGRCDRRSASELRTSVFARSFLTGSRRSGRLAGAIERWRSSWDYSARPGAILLPFEAVCRSLGHAAPCGTRRKTPHHAGRCSDRVPMIGLSARLSSDVPAPGRRDFGFSSPDAGVPNVLKLARSERILAFASSGS